MTAPEQRRHEYPPLDIHATISAELAELARSTHEQLDFLEAVALGLGRRLELGPLEVTTEPAGPNAYVVTATQQVRLR